MRTSLPRSLLICLSLLGPALLLGCGDSGANACTDIAAISVTAKVLDAAGAPVKDAVVEYTVNGGAKKTCENAFGDGSYLCGSEETGTFSITATSKDGTKTKSASVTVTQGECHVNAQTVTITLP
jgi:hypothetical protein